MQYGSIGWSVGATLGYAQAATDKHVISCIGDGTFQVSKVIRIETICVQNAKDNIQLFFFLIKC